MFGRRCLLFALSVCLMCVCALKGAAQQSAELEEAAQLSTQVAKLYSQRKYDEALAPAKRALEIREKALGSEHELVGEALYNLAELYIAKNKFKEAEPFYLRLAAYYEKAAGPEHAQTLKALERLAYIRFRRDNYAEAEKGFLRALEGYEKSATPDFRNATRIALQLGGLYQFQRDSEKAEKMFLHAVELEKKIDDWSDSREQLNASTHYLCFIYETKGMDEGKKMEKELREARLKALNEEAQKAAEDEDDETGLGIINGRAISKPPPDYPREAIKKGIQGSVFIDITVDESGRVSRVKTICGPSELRAASEQAALKARFSPTVLSGKPVKVKGVISYHFFFK